MRISRVSRDRLLVIVPEAGMLNVSDVAGLSILSTDLSAGENVIRLDVTDGVYIFRATYGGKTRTFKLMID